MSRNELSREALSNPKRFYDERYTTGYMDDFVDLFEACRVFTVSKVLRQLQSRGLNPASVLDYGCGAGRYIALLREIFPTASISGGDVSSVGVALAAKKNPSADFFVMQDEALPVPSDSIDLVISVEVLEHVQNVAKSALEMARVLRSNGTMIVTTPCANRYSLDWLINKMCGGFQSSPDGYGRFATDEPGHLRRLTDEHLRALFRPHGVGFKTILHRAHFFTSIASACQERFSFAPTKLMTQIALLDWHMFRQFSNGATMLAIGTKA